MFEILKEQYVNELNFGWIWAYCQSKTIEKGIYIRIPIKGWGNSFLTIKKLSLGKFIGSVDKTGIHILSLCFIYVLPRSKDQKKFKKAEKLYWALERLYSSIRVHLR